MPALVPRSGFGATNGPCGLLVIQILFGGCAHAPEAFWKQRKDRHHANFTSGEQPRRWPLTSFLSRTMSTCRILSKHRSSPSAGTAVLTTARELQCMDIDCPGISHACTDRPTAASAVLFPRPRTADGPVSIAEDRILSQILRGAVFNTLPMPSTRLGHTSACVGKEREKGN